MVLDIPRCFVHAGTTQVAIDNEHTSPVLCVNEGEVGDGERLAFSGARAEHAQ